MQKLPVSTYTFERIIEENQLYVDKTRQMYDVMEYSHMVFLSRPRRFGKSLLLSTFAALFEGKKELFKGLWIEDKMDWQIYPVIQLNFATLTYNLTRAIFDESGIRILKRVAQKYNIKVEASTFGGYLDELIYQLYQKTGQQVVLLIDEYDKPISDYLSDLMIAERNKEWLRDIFEKIKANEGIIRFFMLTGISKFAKMSVFSVLNNMKDITLVPQFNDVTGFVENDIKKYFAAFIPVFAQEQGLSEAAALEKIRHWYNGYSWDGQHKVYNPFSVVNLFQSLRVENFWFESGTPQFLIKLIKSKYAFENTNYSSVLEFERIKTDTSIYQAYDLANINLTSLLLQTGYLTIIDRTEEDGEDDIVLSYPNQEVRLAFSKYVLEAFTHKNRSLDLPQQTIPLRNALREENMDLFMTQIKAFFASIPYILRKTANEAYYQTVFYALLSSLGFRLLLEKMTDKGRIDAILETNDAVYIMEYKYSQTGTMTYWLKKGMKQIHKIGYFEQFEGKGKNIFLVSVAFLDKKIKKKTADLSNQKIENRVLTIDYLFEKI